MRWGALVACLLIAGQVWAVQPDEVLSDPALEARARAISKELRCPICQSENIDESNAGVARDLRLVVRERLVAGDTDRQVVDFVVARYGEYVLFRPQFSLGNAVLWLAGPLFLLLGLVISVGFIRNRATPAKPQALSATEQERLAKLLEKD